MKVGPASQDDRDTVIGLWEAAGLTRPWNDPVSDYELAMRTFTSDVLIARSTGRIVGCVMVGFDGHRGWVYYLASDPSRRCEGIGRLLMSAAEAWLRDRSAPKIQFMVRADNREALAFYDALGFERQDVVTIGRKLD